MAQTLETSGEPFKRVGQVEYLRGIIADLLKAGLIAIAPSVMCKT